MNQSKAIEKITNSYPSISLMVGDTFYWSPADNTVYFKPDNRTKEGIWALLHETGHALLEHKQYFTDVELIKMELQAWEKAKEIGGMLNISINEDHIQDCLDSYRDWLHKRNLCPDCHLSGIQVGTKIYTCVFCHKKWHVSEDRFCRPYRRKSLK